MNYRGIIGVFLCLLNLAHFEGLAQKNKEKRISDSLMRLSNKYARTNYDSAVYFCELILARPETQKDLFALQDVYHQMGTVSHYDNRFEASIEWLLKALEINQQRKDTHNIVLNMSEIAVNYLILNDKPSETSKKWVEKAQLYAARAHDSTKVILRATSLGQYYMKSKNYRAALDGFLANLPYLYSIKKQNLALLNTYNNIGLMYQKLNLYDSAEVYFKKCEAIPASIIHNRSKAFSIINYAINDYLKGNANGSIQKTKQGLSMMSHFKAPQKVIDAYENLTNCYISLKQYDSALYYIRLKNELKDSVFSLELMGKVKAIETKFEIEKRDKEIAEQNLFIAAQANKQRLTVFITVSIALILLLTLIAFFIIRKKNRALSNSEEEVKRNLEEKELLLGEIHHRVKNNLQLINGLLGLQLNQLTDEPAKKAISDSMNRVYAMSSIHQNLYKGKEFKDVEVAPYLKHLTETIFNSLQANAIKVEYDIQSFSLPIDMMVPLGLITNELLTNVFKYAFIGRTDGKVRISFRQEGESVKLQVQDNGVGLSDSHGDSKQGFGFRLIRSLARQLKAEFSILKDNGTKAELIIKLKVADF